jgi:hypothetical protein
MHIFISIDGVLRNIIQKFDYHYKDAYLSSDFVNETDFEYGITPPIHNDNLFNSYKFQSLEEFEFFLFVEYPIEIFGHAGLSYSNTFTELNKLIHENPEHQFTLVGLNEFGKAKPATLFFLSKNGFLGNNIRFIKSNEIWNAWHDCHLWITDNKMIIDKKLDKKEAIKFKTEYNNFFTCEEEITKLSEIKRPWLKFSENATT